LAGNRRDLARALVLALILPLALSACGRKGPLDPPPSAATPSPLPAPSTAPGPGPTTFIDPLTPTGQAQPAAPPPAPVQTTRAAPAAKKKTFLLDPLIQ